MPNWKLLDVVELAEKEDETFCGCTARVTGRKDGVLFVVDVWCEHDGRDVEYEHVMGANFLGDSIGEWDTELDFFEKVCEWDKFMKVLNWSYKRWAATLTSV